MNISFFDLPYRPAKPRARGLNILIDNGLATNYFEDIVTSHTSLIDMVKFGWCTAVVTQEIDKKIAILKSLNIQYFFGGTFFEKACQQDKVEEFRMYLHGKDCQLVEISNGTISLSPERKAKYIKSFAQDFMVLSEVGIKDNDRSKEMSPREWVDEIAMDFEAGATYVITESRESGKSGIARSNGEVRYGLVNEILESDRYDVGQLIFEAPNKMLQNYFIQLQGTNVNLANIAFSDIVGCETLRLGLRSDTLSLFEKQAYVEKPICNVI
ncbi:MAG: phosphosulfolactate synthase [Chitinophagales bacterium]